MSQVNTCGLASGRDQLCGTVREMSQCICTRTGRGGKYRAAIWVLSRLYSNETSREFLPKFVHKKCNHIKEFIMALTEKSDKGKKWECGSIALLSAHLGYRCAPLCWEDKCRVPLAAGHRVCCSLAIPSLSLQCRSSAPRAMEPKITNVGQEIFDVPHRTPSRSGFQFKHDYPQTNPWKAFILQLIVISMTQTMVLTSKDEETAVLDL